MRDLRADLAPSGVCGRQLADAERRAAVLRREFGEKQQHVADLAAELEQLIGETVPGVDQQVV